MMEEESTEPEAVSSVLILEVPVVVSSSSVYPISFRVTLPMSMILRGPIATPYAILNWLLFAGFMIIVFLRQFDSCCSYFPSHFEKSF